MKKQDIVKVFEEFKKVNPNPKCELDYKNEYTFLIAIILSAQATDKGVNKATPALFAKIDNPQDMLELGIDGLKDYIKTIGLYNNKAKSIINMSADLIDKFEGKVPSNQKDLESLPGVGIKTAKVFLNSLYQTPVIAVDTHVSRVSQRLGLSKNTNPVKIGEDLERVVPEEYKAHAGHWLVLHGRYICKAKKPDCDACPISDCCLFFKQVKK
jgi:endonuclease III